MALLAVEVPEHHWVGFVLIALNAYLGDARMQLLGRCSDLTESGKVTFHVGQKHRHTHPRKAFGQHHQTDGLASSGRTGDQAVSIAEFAEQVNLRIALANQDVSHAVLRNEGLIWRL